MFGNPVRMLEVTEILYGFNNVAVYLATVCNLSLNIIKTQNAYYLLTKVMYANITIVFLISIYFVCRYSISSVQAVILVTSPLAISFSTLLCIKSIIILCVFVTTLFFQTMKQYRCRFFLSRLFCEISILSNE